MTILGIDPGMQGALAVYDPSHLRQTNTYDLPVTMDGLDARALFDLLTKIKAVHAAWPAPHNQIQAVVENVGSRPRQQGAFAFGLSTGIIHGCLASAGIPFTLISPAVWKPAMGLRRLPEETVAENKSRARALAVQLFPDLAPDFKRVKDDGRAEALLLAVYFANRRT